MKYNIETYVYIKYDTVMNFKVRYIDIVPKSYFESPSNPNDDQKHSKLDPIDATDMNLAERNWHLREGYTLMIIETYD